MAADFQGVYPTDYYGNAITSLPLMKDVKTAKDFDLAVPFPYGGGDEWILKHWASAYGVPEIFICLTMSAPIAATNYAAFHPKGLMPGYIAGIRGVAEYESLLKAPRGALRRTDALNVAQLMMMFFIILGNLVYLATKYRKGAK